MPLLRFALMVLLVAGCQGPTDPAVVATTSGHVRGFSDSIGVTAFRGIPYAAPPVDTLRWRPPHPASRWIDTLSADAVRPACLQPPSLRRFYQAVATRLGGDTASIPLLGATAEDCLYLNIWTPAANRRAPVFVWIHGGGGTSGSGNEPVFDGARLAARGVVVVTVSYRLGPLGFLAHPALSAESRDGVSGNYGLLDLIAALRWVHENIAAFGGDPDRVTIGGQSAGATLAAHLMVMPGATGLFHGVILQSPSGFDMAPKLRGDQSGEALGRALASALQLPESVSPSELRRIPGDALLRAAFTNGLVPDGPVIDGVHLPIRPSDAFGGPQLAVVPLLVGSNAAELGSLPFLLPAPPASRQEWEAAVHRSHPENSAVLIAAYGARFGGDLVAAVEAMTTDEFFRAPILQLARRVSEVGTPVYAYLFSAAPKAVRASGLGAFHSAELPFVFGNDIPGWWTSDASDRAISSMVMDYWAAFIATGDPNGDARPAWPRFAEAAPQFLEIGTPVTARAFEIPVLDALLATAVSVP